MRDQSNKYFPVLQVVAHGTRCRDKSPHRYTLGMTTTIKVSREVRDRLKAQAASARRTLGEQLEHLAELGERTRRFEQLQDAIRSTDASTLDEYRVEVAAWDAVDRD